MIAAVTSTWAPVGSTAAAVLVVVFLAAAVTKIVRPDPAGLRALGLPGPRLLASALPVVELLLVALLVVDPSTGATVAAGLLALFTLFVVRLVWSGSEVACGCFGSSRSPATWATVGRNLTLLVVAALATTGSTWTVPGPEAVAVVVAVLVLGALTGQLAELWATVGRPWSVGPSGPTGGPAGGPVPIPVPSRPAVPQPRRKSR